MPPTPRPHGPKKKANVKVPSAAGESSNRRLLVILGAAGLAVIVAAVLGYVLLGGGSSSASSDAPRLLEAAGCTVQTVKSLPSNVHTVLTPEGISKKWNTDPPTNGPHYGTPAIWGAYTEPLLAAQVIHNLEHGGVFIQYGKDVPQATIDELKGFYDRHQNGTLLAPLPRLGSKIALGAWTTNSPSTPDSGTARVAQCTTFNEEAFTAFFDAYQFNGPERFPASSLTPGS